MNVEKLDENCYYYTDLIPKEESEYVLSILKQPEDWVKIYNKGWVYNPNRDPEIKANQSGMIAFRKEFNEKKYPEVNKIISKAFYIAAEHYAKEKKLDNVKPFNEFSHIDKHCPGTVYGTHIDTAPVDLESYSILFYLNDDYEGGEISFSLPDPNKKIEVVNGNLEVGPNGLYPPDHEKNKDLVSFWLKPKAFSVLIFPPLKPHIYPHTAYEVRSGDKYLIKGHWQVEEGTSTNFVNDPYIKDDGTKFTEYELKIVNPGASIEGGIVPDEYKKFYI
jgi:hypothetical protein